MKSNDFAAYLSAYFLKYLPSRTGYSDNTVKSYRDSFVIFLRYCKSELGIKPEKMDFTRINRKMIEDFLSWLECRKKHSVSTRNLRLAAFHAFFRYIQLESPEYMELCSSILAVKSKKAAPKEINYFSIEGVKILLSIPDPAGRSGRRDLAVLALSYDTGARVQEIADLKAADIRIKTPSTIRPTGKGNKTRIIPLMPQTMSIIKKYMDDCSLLDEAKGTEPLFFNRKGKN